MKFEPCFMTITVTTSVQHKYYKQWGKTQRETEPVRLTRERSPSFPKSPYRSQIEQISNRSFSGQWLRQRVPLSKPGFLPKRCPNRILRFLF